jgi:hypothetical protein
MSNIQFTSPSQSKTFHVWISHLNFTCISYIFHVCSMFRPFHPRYLARSKTTKLPTHYTWFLFNCYVRSWVQTFFSTCYLQSPLIITIRFSTRLLLKHRSEWPYIVNPDTVRGEAANSKSVQFWCHSTHAIKNVSYNATHPIVRIT